MKNTLFTVLIILMAIACSCGIDNKPIYIATYKSIDSVVVSEVKDDYFEISLHSMQSGTNYKASKEYKDSEGDWVFIDIVDMEGERIRFTNSTEFLNFISERGYEMVDQSKEKYITHYTFKKK